jgi:cytochrome c-type biogenesis protein
VEFQGALQSWWAPALAFAAGAIAFASPCVLPLVPGYLSFVSGGPGSEEERRPIVPILLFILGFAVVFTSLGAFSSLLLPVFRSEPGRIVAGILVGLVGTAMLLYAFGVGGARLFAEWRPFMDRVRPGSVGALPLGMAFAAGWTPCVGPVLAGIYGLALAQGGGLWGTFLLFMFSLGLGLPFVLVGLGVGRLMRALSFIRRNYHWYAGVSGTLLVAIGVLLATNLWTRLLSQLGILRLLQFEPPL